MPVYILQLERPLGNERHAAQFYVGFAQTMQTLPRRIEHHKAGRGSAFTRAAVEKNISFEVVLVLPDGTREDERKIKAQHNTRQFLERHFRREQKKAGIVLQ